MAPMNAFLNIVGMETMGLRLERIFKNAYFLASKLDEMSSITVNYPMLSHNPYRELCERQFDGRGGAILTIRAGSKERAYKLMNALKYAAKATNIGDIRTLVIHPASTIYVHSTEEQKQAAGVFSYTIRVSVGIENIEDLIEDFVSAVNNL